MQTIKLLAGLIFSSAAITSPIFGEEEKKEKWYIEPSLLYIGHEGIFLASEGNFLPLERVYQDEQGICAIPMPNAWRCNNCHHHNPYPTKRCYGCKLTREESGS